MVALLQGAGLWDGQDLDRHYRDRRGNRSTHAIKADTLRRSRAGDVLLMAVRADNSKLRSYLVDRILGVKATQTPFTPRYPIELRPLGPQSIPRTASPNTVHLRGIPVCCP